jgi:hypothetical protein
MTWIFDDESASMYAQLETRKLRRQEFERILLCSSSKDTELNVLTEIAWQLCRIAELLEIKMRYKRGGR